MKGIREGTHRPIMLLKMTNITIDGQEYDISNASDEAKAQLNNLKFVNEQILQRNNELQIAQTAKIGWLNWTSSKSYISRTYKGLTVQ